MPTTPSAPKCVSREQLLPWGRIAGRLVDEHGKALPRWTVRARPTGEGGKTRSTTTDGNGAFEIQADPELDYRLEVHPHAGFKGFIRSTNGDFAIFSFVHTSDTEPPAGRRIIECTWLGAVRGATDDLLLSVPAHRLPSAVISGRIVDPDGGGLAASLRVYVDDRYRTVKTKAGGRFEIGPVIPGAYRIEVVCKDQRWAPFDLDVEALSPGQRVKLGDVTPPRR